MKIMIVAQRYHTNQIPICQGLKADGHEVKYFVQAVGAVEDHSVVTPVQMKLSLLGRIIDKRLRKKYDASTYESKLVDRFLPSFWWMVKQIKAYKPDVVIMRYRIPSNLITNMACKLLGIKTRILYNQTDLYTKKTAKLSWKKKLYFSFFPKVRMTTVGVHDAFDLKYHKDELEIRPHEYFLPYIIEPNPKAESRSYFKDGMLNILDVGKYRPYKNHYVLVNAVKVLKDKGELNNMRFTILGQASVPEEIKYYEDLQAHARECGVSEYITFRTHIPYSEMMKLYYDNDVFILTSLEEQASISILEAMSNAVVAVSTNLNGTAHYIKEGETGFLFKTNDPENLADVIKNISDNRNKVPQWGSNGYNDIKENYMYKNYKAAISEVLEKEFGVKM